MKEIAEQVEQKLKEYIFEVMDYNKLERKLKNTKASEQQIQDIIDMFKKELQNVMSKRGDGSWLSKYGDNPFSKVYNAWTQGVGGFLDKIHKG